MPASRSGSLGRADVAAMALVLAVADILATVRLTQFPKPWFDEGWWLQVPANLIEYGEYASRSSEGFRRFDTVLITSPAFFLPISAAFGLFGVGLLQARIVVVLFYALASVLAYAIGRRLRGPVAGALAASLFMTVRLDDPFTSLLILGRQVLPELPAIALLLLATYLWLPAIDRQGNVGLLLAALCFGVAATIKPQFAILIVPSVAVTWAWDRWYLGHRRAKAFAAPLLGIVAVAVAQQVWLIAMLGASGYATFLDSVYNASGPQVRVLFEPIAMRSAAGVLLRNPYIGLVLAALLYTAMMCLDRRRARTGLCFLVAFCGVALCWFSFASIGWARYIVPALAIAHLLVAVFLADLGGWSEGSAVPEADGVSDLRPARRLAVVLVALWMVMSSMYVTAREMAATDDASQRFSAQLLRDVEPNAVIETWEWEIAFLARGLRFHHPPTEMLNVFIAEKRLGLQSREATYDPLRFGPSYFVTGPFSQWTGVYPVELLRDRTTVVNQIGEYELRRVLARAANGAGPPASARSSPPE